MKVVYARNKTTQAMKTKKELTYGRAILFGIGTELILIAVQYVLLAIYHSKNPQLAFSFSSEYMMTRGFYIFLIPGFIMYAMVIYLMLQKYAIASVAYVFVLLLVAAVIEVIFYLSIAATYQGAFVFSILDKVVGAALGAIGYFAVGRTEEAN